MAEPINVTKTFLPEKHVFDKHLQDVWDSVWLTNNGPKVRSLEDQIKENLQLKNLLFTNNGTIALQLAIHALDISGEVITTPFSYCATTTAILWEHCVPVFVDIDPRNYNIDASKIELAITPKTTAILATHVFGRICDVKAIEQIANKHNLKVIYDGAHAFGSTYNGRSALSFGDITTCSFHATKLFHTIEGGAVIAKDDAINDKLNKIRSFGHQEDDHFLPGINGKSSEIHACMGLAVLPHVAELVTARKQLAIHYDALLDWSKLTKPTSYFSDEDHNAAYYAVVFETEDTLLKVRKALKEANINIRRYFYPSLNQLPYITAHYSCPISEDIAPRVACLPIYHDLSIVDQQRIAKIVNDNI